MFEEALILAGGLGTRLRPLTYAVPKPLLPIGEKPIIERIIENLKKQGIINFYISINYKGEMIKNYLKEGESLGVNIHYVEEEVFTGTAGPILHLPDDIQGDLVIYNGDVLCNIDLKKLHKLLEEGQFDFVISSVKKEDYIDFGVLEFDENSKCLLGWKEKPTFYFYLNTGIYGIKKETIEFIKSQKEKNTQLSMPDLWSLLMEKGKKIGIYEHDGEWFDIGKMDEYLKVNKEVEK
jgi:NDP-sugar pyrophosphorylase family protein